MGDATLYTVLPTHTAEAGISLAAVGVILAVNRAIRVLLNGPAGVIYDRHPRRRLLIPALYLGALSTAIYGLTRGFWPLMAGRLLWGLAWSGIWIGGNTIVLDVTHQRNRGRWTGLYQAWFFVGGSLGFLLGGLLTDCLGYHTAMLFGAAISAVGALPALLFLPETRGRRRTDDPLPSTSALPPSGDRVPPDRRGMAAVIGLQGVNRFAIAGVMAATLTLLLQERLGDHLALGGVQVGVTTLSGALLAARMLLSMVVAPLVGSLSDRVGSRWCLVPWNVLAAAASMAMLAFGTPLTIVLAALLGAVSSGGLQSLVIALAGDLSPPALRGRSMGLLHTAGDAGSAAGPLLAYALLPYIGLAGTYCLCAGLFVLSLGMLWRWGLLKPSIPNAS
jgi:MFS family permease